MKKADKIKFNYREIAHMIVSKYPQAEIKLLHESPEVYVYIIHKLVIHENEAIIMMYYTTPEIPFSKSFEFFTKNKYFAIPI